MKNKFTIKRVGGAESVGEILFEARKKSKDSLDDISEKLKIRKKYLLNLEKGNYHDLPAEVYVLGFLKSYAEHLNLDKEKIFELYRRERSIMENIKKKHVRDDRPKKFRSSSLIITPKMIKISAIILAIFGLFFYLWYQISGLSSAPKLLVKEPYSDKTINEDTIVIVGETKEGADVTINGQSVYVDADGNFRESVGLQEGLNTLRIVATNKLDKENVIERKIMVEKDQLASAAKSEEVFISEDDKDLELVVTIKDKATWVHVEEDGRNAYSGTMLPDAAQVFTAKEYITISSGKANTTYVKFNGKDIGALGDVGDVIRDMKFTKDISLSN